MVKSSKPGKQRKAVANASKQNKRRRLRARLATNDSRFALICETSSFNSELASLNTTLLSSSLSLFFLETKKPY